MESQEESSFELNSQCVLLNQAAEENQPKSGSHMETAHDMAESTMLLEANQEEILKELSDLPHPIKEEVMMDYGEDMCDNSNDSNSTKRQNDNFTCMKAESGEGNSGCDTPTMSSSTCKQRQSNIVYRCKYCGQQLQKFVSLQKHEDAHRDGSIYKCRYCEYYSLQRARIEAHERKHTGERPYSCNKCDYRCASQGDLVKHVRVHGSDRKYNCPLCSFTCKWAGGISKHLLSHSDDRPFRCNECGMGFKAKHALKNHMKLHSDEKGFSCDLCAYTCKTPNLLNQHRKTHSDVRNFACTHSGCTQRCKTRSDLVKHMSVHVTSLDFKCIICNKKFKCKHSLRCHTLRHEKSEHPCKVCGKVLASRSGLQLHMTLHTGKRFECRFCGHRFASTNNLSVHMRVHDVSRTFRCPICLNGFETANHLFTHIGSMHGKDYVYFCELCQRPYSRYMLIKFHIDRNHKGADTTTVHEFVYNSQCCSESDNFEKKFSYLMKEYEKESEGINEVASVSKNLSECLSSPSALSGVEFTAQLQENMNESIIATEKSAISCGNRTIEEATINGKEDIGESNMNDKGNVMKEKNDAGEHGHDSIGDGVDAGCTSTDILQNHMNTDASARPFDRRNLKNVSADMLGNKTLTVKLEKLPDSIDRNKDSSVFNSSKIEHYQNALKENLSRIIRLGTYANVGIIIAGKKSGVKFDIKRGKKSSKWFLKPDNLIEEAAVKASKYFTTQAKYFQRNTGVRRKRGRQRQTDIVNGLLGSPTPRNKSESAKRRKKSENWNEKTDMGIKLNKSEKRKKKKKKFDERNSQSHASFNNPTDVTDSTITVKVEVDEEYNLDIAARLCYNTQLTEDQENDKNPAQQTTSSLSQSEPLRVNVGGLLSAEKIDSSLKVKGWKSGKQTNGIKSSKLKSRKDIPLSQGGKKKKRIRKHDTDTILMEYGDIGRHSTYSNQPTIIQQEEQVHNIPTAVVGVENVVDSPVQITWKKVGGNRTRISKIEIQSRVHPISSKDNGAEKVVQAVIHEEDKIVAVEIGNCTVMSRNDENVENLSQLKDLGKGNESDFVREKKENNTGGSSIKENENNVESNDAVKLFHGKSSPESPSKSIKVLSLKEFEEEYMKRPKLVANISLAHNKTRVVECLENRKTKTTTEVNQRGRILEDVQKADILNGDSISNENVLSTSDIIPEIDHEIMKNEPIIMKKAQKKKTQFPRIVNEKDSSLSLSVESILSIPATKTKSKNKGETKLKKKKIQSKLKVSSLFGTILKKKYTDDLQVSFNGEKILTNKKEGLLKNDIGESKTHTSYTCHEKQNLHISKAYIQQTVSDHGQQQMSNDLPGMNFTAMNVTNKDNLSLHSNISLKSSKKFKNKSAVQKSTVQLMSLKPTYKTNVKKLGDGPMVRKKQPKQHCCQSPAVNNIGASASEEKIKLPGLTSDNLVERRMTVECVTSSPTVSLKHVLTTEHNHLHRHHSSESTFQSVGKYDEEMVINQNFLVDDSIATAEISIQQVGDAAVKLEKSAVTAEANEVVSETREVVPGPIEAVAMEIKPISVSYDIPVDNDYSEFSKDYYYNSELNTDYSELDHHYSELKGDTGQPYPIDLTFVKTSSNAIMMEEMSVYNSSTQGELVHK